MGREDFQFKYYQNMRTSVSLYIYMPEFELRIFEETDNLRYM